MCIGVPMQVVAIEGLRAMCRAEPTAPAAPAEEVDLSLVGECEPGQWLLVFLGAARERLDPNDAALMLDARAALQTVMAGGHDVDHLFADLINREPQLPEHLRAQVDAQQSKPIQDEG